MRPPRKSTIADDAFCLLLVVTENTATDNHSACNTNVNCTNEGTACWEVDACYLGFCACDFDYAFNAFTQLCEKRKSIHLSASHG